MKIDCPLMELMFKLLMYAVFPTALSQYRDVNVERFPPEPVPGICPLIELMVIELMDTFGAFTTRPFVAHIWSNFATLTNLYAPILESVQSVAVSRI